MDKRPTYEELERRIRVLEAECAKGKEAEAALRASEARYHDQIDLNLQNCTLLELRNRLEQSLERYTELYDFAPVGYFTLSADGAIRELNLVGAALLGQERSRLLAQRFGPFVSEQTRPDFSAFLDRVLVGTTREHCEIALAREGMPICHMRLEGVGIQDGGEWLGRIAAMDITERKRIEAVLRESEAWLQLALSAGRMVAWRYDPATRQITFSKDAEKVLELPQRHETSDQGYALIHPDDVEHHRALVDGAIATGGHYASICRHVHGEQVIWLEEHAQAVVDRAGQTVRLVGVTQNITERKRAEESLHAREQHYRLLIESLHSGVVVHAPDTEILLANEQAGRMLGLSVDAMTGKTAADPAWVFVRENETPMSSDEYPVNRVLAERQPVRNLILGIRHPHTGDRVWVLVNATPEFDDAGHLLQIVATFIDITDRKRVEIALRESEARLQRVLDAANDGFWEWNVATGETTFSGRWAEMLGYDVAEIEHRLDIWERCVHPDDLAGVWATVNTYLASSETYRFRTEYRMRAKNGEWRWILSRAKITARDDRGRPLRVSGTHTDITDAKIAERALRAALEENTVLMKEIHHRVKNNLSVLSSLLGLQADRTFVPEAAAVFRVMQDRIQSMGLLHEALYRSDNLARIGLPDYLETLCARLWDAVGPETRRIALERQIDDVSLPLVQAVPCGLMVNELIANALKHAFPGGRDGRIRLMAKAGADRELLLTVADDGVGLPPTLAPHRADTLGLQLVDILVRQLRGRLDVATGTGTGTTFHIAFPIKDV